MIDEYRTIDRFPGYRFGRDGSVWSCRCKAIGMGRGKATIGTSWRTMSPSGIRPHVHLASSDGTIHRNQLVSHLILEAFVGPKPDGMEACHFPDRDTRNNSIENLRWDTRSGNFNDMWAHGTKVVGEKHRNSKLTSDNVREIRRLHGIGVSQVAIAKQFGFRKSTTISMIVRRLAWQWLD